MDREYQTADICEIGRLLIKGLLFYCSICLVVCDDEGAYMYLQHFGLKNIFYE
jgi:hypothetical protein